MSHSLLALVGRTLSYSPIALVGRTLSYSPIALVGRTLSYSPLALVGRTLSYSPPILVGRTLFGSCRIFCNYRSDWNNRGRVVLELASVYSTVRQTTEAFDKLTFALLLNSTYLTN